LEKSHRVHKEIEKSQSLQKSHRAYRERTYGNIETVLKMKICRLQQSAKNQDVDDGGEHINARCQVRGASDTF